MKYFYLILHFLYVIFIHMGSFVLRLSNFFPFYDVANTWPSVVRKLCWFSLCLLNLQKYAYGSYWFSNDLYVIITKITFDYCFPFWLSSSWRKLMVILGRRRRTDSFMWKAVKYRLLVVSLLLRQSTFNYGSHGVSVCIFFLQNKFLRMCRILSSVRKDIQNIIMLLLKDAWDFRSRWCGKVSSCSKGVASVHCFAFKWRFKVHSERSVQESWHYGRPKKYRYAERPPKMPKVGLASLRSSESLPSDA